MLVLSRKNRESVVVGGADGFHRLLKVTVLDIRGTNVKLGFEVDAECSRPSFGGVGTNQRRGRSDRLTVYRSVKGGNSPTWPNCL